ncbi:beta-1,3-galactosyltransferase 5-like [Hypanus sabinus]|uniref:beta-1,3-galactosyltransferase 5-like n=1 Tax=Hypanus sabinus TaxID=79690 RepID=UPI0028C4F65E|nr:beta-1,3-galactosyltransferase 5-like [Hypanus sabinus]
MYRTPQCVKRILKVSIPLLVVPCLIKLTLVWMNGDTRPLCHSRVNGTTFLMQPVHRCDSGGPFLVLLVTSSPEQFEARSVIRRTWGSERRTAGRGTSVTYFLLGRGRERQELIRREGEVHGDIIQGDFGDTYYNLTYKVLLGLQWLCNSCPSATFVMKTDSDMFVNTDYLLELLSREPRRRDLFTGFIMDHSLPIRNIFSKWYVSAAEYPMQTYPPFCSGTGYVLSTDLACRVCIISRAVPLFKLEDVYVGLCLAELKVKPLDIHDHPVFHNYRVPFSICSYRQLVTSHRVTPTEQADYWRQLQAFGNEKCPGD